MDAMQVATACAPLSGAHVHATVQDSIGAVRVPPGRGLGPWRHVADAGRARGLRGLIGREVYEFK